jgi:2-polyprenyl-3-methyl-5-hydroxy-6-metoxy-1,4-benzoquinol methylase
MIDRGNLQNAMVREAQLEFSASDLDHFVRRSDELGGPGMPGCEAFWAGFSYRMGDRPNESLDPFSEAYVQEQLRLYEELSGRSYDAPAHEQTSFELDRHIAASNPYDHPSPAGLALHIQRLSAAMRRAAPSRGQKLLDMGCGWGLSSEVAAYHGLRVSAVDINPTLVSLVNQRAARLNNPITAHLSTFEDYTADTPADLAMFYDCLHHSVRPWLALKNVGRNLTADGKIVLLGEPFYANWWAHWGMRLDALLVYCIRKFGWFESGWSLDFMRQVLSRAGFVSQGFVDADPDMGPIVVARRMPKSLSGAEIAGTFEVDGGLIDQDNLILVGAGTIRITYPETATGALLHKLNYRSGELRMRLVSDGFALSSGQISAGPNDFQITRRGDVTEIDYSIERWVPDEEMGNGDKRVIGLHLQRLTFIP